MGPGTGLEGVGCSEVEWPPSKTDREESLSTVWCVEPGWTHTSLQKWRGGTGNIRGGASSLVEPAPGKEMDASALLLAPVPTPTPGGGPRGKVTAGAVEYCKELLGLLAAENPEETEDL